MNSLLRCSLLAAASALTLGAADEKLKIELRAEKVAMEGQILRARGAATAVIGEMKVTAEEISFDEKSGRLTSAGDTLITSGQITIQARGVRIDTRPLKSPVTPLPTREIRDLPSGKSRL